MIGEVAVKIPSLVEWRLFLLGLLANMQESKFSKTGWPELCPVLFSIPGGFMVIQKRAVPVCEEEYFAMSFEDLTIRDNYIVPAEDKPDSWGKIKGKIVAVDYGN